MNRERRSLHGGGLRAFEQDGEHYITARVVRYDVTDDYGSRWAPGVFDKSIEQRMPTLAWAHSWNEPLGRAVEAHSDPEGPILTFRLDDFEDVPTARRAYSQVKSGTLDDVSVGFSDVLRRPPTNEERDAYPGMKEMILGATLDEVSIVLRGAVSGAKIMALRSVGQVIDAELAGQILARFAAGETDLLGALSAVKEAATDETPPDNTEDKPEDKPAEKPENEQVEVPLDPDTTADNAEDFDGQIDEALALTSRLD